nr:MAK10-like protein [Tanacetum cinerariifolium]
MGDENPIRTLGDYSKPSHEGYGNTIELAVGNNVVPLQSDTIQLVELLLVAFDTELKVFHTSLDNDASCKHSKRDVESKAFFYCQIS